MQESLGLARCFGQWVSVLFSRIRWAAAQKRYFQGELPLWVVLNCLGSLVCLAWGYINRFGLRKGFFLYQVTGQFRRVFCMACFLEPLAFSLLNYNSFRTETEISLRKQVASKDKASCLHEREVEEIISSFLSTLTWDFERSKDTVVITVLISWHLLISINDLCTIAATYQSFWFFYMWDHFLNC